MLTQISHILKAIALLFLAAAGFFVLRSLMTPDSFGVQHGYTYGYYRGASPAEQAALPAQYQGSSSCLGCHEPAAASWKQGKHAGVACEACHGICRSGRNEAGEKPVSDSSAAACLRCHAALRGRPGEFPQVGTMDQHVHEKVGWGCMVGGLVVFDSSRGVQEKGDPFAQGVRCVLCHDAHHPLLKIPSIKKAGKLPQEQAADTASRSIGETP